MTSEIERWMRKIEDTLAEHDRRIRSKPSSDPSQGFPPTGPAGGALTGTYPNPTLAAGSVTGGAGGAIADGTITHVDIAAANKDGAAATPSMRTLGTGATQAAAGNDARLSDARTPLAHQHSGADITSGTVAFARLPTGTTSSTVAVGNHTHTLSGITAGGTLAPPLVMTIQSATPGSIPAGSKALYFKADGYAYTVTSAGVEQPLIPKPDQLHVNPTLDNTTMTTSGGGSSTVVNHEAPTGWSWFWSTSGLYWESDETVTLYGLGKSAKMVLTADSQQSLLLSNVFAVTPGSLLTISGWCRGTGGVRAFTTIATSTPAGNADFFDGGNTITGDSPLVATSTTWQKVTQSVVVPAGHTKARLMLRADSFGGSTGGTIWWDESESSVQIAPPAQVISGEIKMWPGAAAPDGYLLCNGGTFSSETYPSLAAILGDTFGTHSGTTYYLPDFRGRMPLGVGTASPAVGGGTNHTLAQKGGEETHLLTAAESGVPAHSHTTSVGNDSPDHSHGVDIGYSELGTPNWNLGSGSNNRSTNLFTSSSTGGASARHSHSVTVNNNTAANASARHNVLNPYLGINFIIKT